jgi:putative endonuclease
MKGEGEPLLFLSLPDNNDCYSIRPEDGIISWYCVIPAKAGIQKAMRNYYVYILASQRNGTLYIGVTNDLVRRIHEHKNNEIEGFTKKYNIKQLVHYEQTNEIAVAIAREKQLKAWHRIWKLRLIEENNPEWRDLYEYIAES